jgi:hypothetical protein
MGLSKGGLSLKKKARNSVIHDHLEGEDLFGKLRRVRFVAVRRSVARETEKQSSGASKFLSIRLYFCLGLTAKSGLLTKAERRRDYLCVQAHCVI